MENSKTEFTTDISNSSSQGINIPFNVLNSPAGNKELEFDTQLSCFRSALYAHKDQFTVDINNNSIVIVDNFDFFQELTIVGESAEEENSAQTNRQYGVDLGNAFYLTLLKARLASVLGTGNHNINLAVIAADKGAEKLVESLKDTKPTEYAFKKFQETLEHIQYKVGSTENATSSCNIKLDNLDIITESKSVMQLIPVKAALSCLVLQIGHGDMQLSLVKNGNLISDSTQRGEGMSYAIDTIYSQQNVTKLRFPDFMKAWTTNNILPDNGFSENGGKDITKAKTRAIELYINDTLPKLLKPFDPRNLKCVVISGGGANDPIVVDTIKNYFNRDAEWLKVFTIEEITSNYGTENGVVQNQMSASLGALSILNKKYPTAKCNVAVDAGNGFAKIAIRFAK